MDQGDNLDLLLVQCCQQNPDFHFAKLKVDCWLFVRCVNINQHAFFSWMQTFKIMHRPWGSTIFWSMLQLCNTIFKQNHHILRIRTTVTTYQLSTPFISPLTICCSGRNVSCKRTMSALRLRHQRKIFFFCGNYVCPSH